MAVKDRTTLKSYFETGDRPTASQFSDFIDSYLHKFDGAAVKGWSFDPIGGKFSIILSDGNNISVVFPTTENIDKQIEDILKLLEEKVDKVNGMGLSSNDFTQNFIDQINAFADFISNYNPSDGLEYKGGFIVSLADSESFDTAAISPAEKLNSLPAFNVENGSFILFIFYELSLVRRSKVQRWQTFAVKGGSYGIGLTGAINLLKDSDAITPIITFTDARAVILNNGYRFLSLPYDNEGDSTPFNRIAPYTSRTQEEYNLAVYNRITRLSVTPIKTKALTFGVGTEGVIGKALEETNVSFTNNKKISFSTKINVKNTQDENSRCWSSVFINENKNSEDNTTKDALIFGVVSGDEPGAFYPVITLMRTKADKSFEAKEFTTREPINQYLTENDPNGESGLKVFADVTIQDFNKDAFSVFMEVNGEVYSLGKGLDSFYSVGATKNEISEPLTVVSPGLYNAVTLNDIDFLTYGTAEGIGANLIVQEFDFNEGDDVPVMSKRALLMDIQPRNNGNRINRTEDAQILAKLQGGDLRAVKINDLYPNGVNTDVLDTKKDQIILNVNTTDVEVNLTLQGVRNRAFIRGDIKLLNNLENIGDNFFLFRLPTSLRPLDTTVLPIKHDTGFTSTVIEFNKNGSVFIIATESIIVTANTVCEARPALEILLNIV